MKKEKKLATPSQERSNRLNELIARAKADLAARPDSIDVKDLSNTINEVESELAKTDGETTSGTDKVAEKEKGFTWNKEQLRAFELAESGKSFCIIGKAGTGKTTGARECLRHLQAKGIVGPLRASTKYLTAGLPGVAVVSFTNRAVKNIARGMPEDIARHTLTVHKLLEFAPERIMSKDADGIPKEVMRFLPRRNKYNPLPDSLRLIIVEESSMISTELWAMLMDAIPHECQFIFLGDLQQLPPVYGSAILGFKLLELPIVELTQIYRQAAGSPIIDFAWRVARGDKITKTDYETITKISGGKLRLRPWKKRLDGDHALHISNLLFKEFVDTGIYDPLEDMVMIPFNKKFGTIDFNKNLANHLGKKRGAIVHEVIAGFNKHYFAIGDKILCDRQEAIIEDIIINDRYAGVAPLPPSDKLNRWGMYELETPQDHDDAEKSLQEVEDFLLKTAALQDKEDEETKQQGSHVLSCRLLGSDDIREVRTAGEYSATIFAYALTIHKCQGSEWRKCFVLLHNSHAVMINRELLYTAVTRAREELYIICEPDTFEKGVKTQRIKGNTIAEKAEYFKGKLEKEGL
jgi:exodeoxyribonuclease V alpha subunit